ncbi:D-2-hydroxyglutarate dehydrogenase, mitochondrial isoform X2 [Nymphaea colorata]|uniref:D-2-hydroxyglutarate dehydrogenase, mitochondrial isoform X2 n=1 Tax=Nymphaea colorata TaxID=210225 RepID=UPI00214F2B8B|nr:D-2-hydroxyglutarate dehydrogenase, mitochondrial isoform X2 [Nymphaea colorata]
MGRWRRASQIVNRLRYDRLFGSPRDSIRGYPAIPLTDIGAQLRREREIVYGSLSGFRLVGGGGTWRTTIRSFGSLASKVARDPSFAKITAEDINYFRKILGVKNVIQDEDRLIASNTDWMRKYKGSSQLLLQPSSTEEVIINVGLLNNITSLDKVSGILVCEAGCILENLDSFLSDHGLMMPLDLGAKGSCQIGGNISTNAGGLRFVRYGSLRGSVLGIEAVLANGSILDLLGTLRKDNTGYDLKQLFIGIEGSLGIVTKVSIMTPARLPSTNLAFLACKDYKSCQKLLYEAKCRLGEILSAFEFLDSESMNMVITYLEGVRNPFPSSDYNFYVLIETTGSTESHDKEKLESFLMKSMEGGLISDGVVAQDMNQTSSFWRIREGISEALVRAGAVYKYDLSLPVEKIYEIVEEMRSRLGQSATVLGYGHLGDGNLHLNVSVPEYDDKVSAKIEPFVYEWTSKHRGSISAEHGLGQMKANEIHYSKPVEAVQLMASIKKLLDPNGIMNPYKVLPQSVLC